MLSSWYGGEETGTAIAQTLAGVNNPAGRLPVTFYKGLDQVPEFTDYSMKSRTYRYFTGAPLYPFGYGLSYSNFIYSGLKTKRTSGGAEVQATVKNTSSREGDEVVQLYVGGGPGEGNPQPARIPKDSSRLGREPASVVYAASRRRSAGQVGDQRWGRADR